MDIRQSLYLRAVVRLVVSPHCNRMIIDVVLPLEPVISKTDAEAMMGF